jgi:UDP-N-acetylmuramyl pentapeptide phosphotransferase/UDP-N-acetylglucosamine-1-phosphate transferase
MLLSVFVAVSLAAFAAWWLLCVLLPKLRRGLLDQPNARSSHSQPTPRGGGVAFVLVAAVAGSIGWFGAAFSGQPSLPGSHLAMVALPLLALPLAVVGFLDDRHNLSSGLRYGVQLATALLLILMSSLPLPLLGLPLLLIAVTAVINFTNFMDGLDGLVGGCMAVALASAALWLAAPWPIWAFVGALLGFLIWNWSPAKVFMGDVGSTFLGAVFAGLVLQAPSWPEALALLSVATPLLGDAFFCVPRRLLAGQRVFQAHRVHLFQRLHQAGWPHGCVSSLYVAATALLATALLTGGLPWVLALAALELLLGVWLDQRVAVPFAVASRS